MLRPVSFVWVIFGSIRIVEVILGAVTTKLYIFCVKFRLENVVSVIFESVSIV